MSLQLSVQAPKRTGSAGAEEPRGANRLVYGRAEGRDPASSFVLACRDVIDEVRLRMAVRGYNWE